ncbi:hypothetical protein D3C73_1539400 [compost metagenome]
MNQTIALQISELNSQHPLGNLRTQSAYFIEALRTADQMIEQNTFPFAANQLNGILE